MEIKPEILGAHALCQSKEFSEVQYRQVVLDTELLLNLNLAAVELELTERADIGECIHLDILEVDQLLVGDVQRVDDIVPADTAAGTTALHLVAVLDWCCTKCGNEFFHPGRVLGIEHDFLLEFAVLVGLDQVAAVVNRNACSGQRVGDAVADFVNPDELVIVEKFSGMVDIDGTFVLHVRFFEHLIDRIRRSLLCLSLWLTSQIDL